MCTTLLYLLDLPQISIYLKVLFLLIFPFNQFCELISQESLTSSLIHPRKVLNPAIRSSAASVIFLHNHPSGDPEPSLDDIEITSRLCKSCDIVGINVLDHIIVGREGYFSFKKKQII